MMGEDARWRAESDARCLVEAKQIVGDKPRLEAAQKVAKVMLEKEEAEAKALRSIVNSADPTRIPPASSPQSKGGSAAGGFKKAVIPDSTAVVPLTIIKPKR